MRKLNLLGMCFGSWVVLTAGIKKANRTSWLCLCTCGKQKLVDTCDLTRGASTNCGCKRAEKTKEAMTTHGMYNTPTYKTWSMMKSRCTNPNYNHYKNYGGRGISYCEDWYTFENFIRDMGIRPAGRTLDRVDNNKGYSKENCKWSTPKEQQNNTRRNKVHD